MTMVSRMCAVQENVAVSTAHATSKRIVFEGFIAGAVFIPPTVSGTIMWWGGAQEDPAGLNQAQTNDYPANQQTGLLGNFAPIINAAGAQVQQTVTGSSTGQWYPIPAECAGFGMLKITSSTVTNVAVCLKS